MADLDSGEIYIQGKNFTRHGALQVTLSETVLTLISADNTMIKAYLPLGLTAGDYLLVVATGEKHDEDKKNKKDDEDEHYEHATKYALTIGGVGLQGDPGPQGDTGPQGLIGLTGAQGLKGDTGTTGAKGDKGDTGATGAQGLRGLKGDTGATGAQGIQGPKGPIGPAGNPASFTPPVITHDAPFSVDAASLTNEKFSINFMVTDESEIAYYAITDNQNPANNRLIVVAPSLNSITVTFDMTFTHQGTNTMLFMAADMEGSISKALIEVEKIGVDCSNFNPHADLSGCDLSGLDLSFVDLSFANLSGAHFIGANLRGANLSNTDMSYANLDSAQLSNANLNSADLAFANLSGANLSEADLTFANLHQANLNGINWNFTICPDGTNSGIIDGDGFTCLNNL